MDGLLTIGELAARTGVATSALRFYEERGLIRAERTEAGHRRYPRAVARRVAFVVFAQRVGLTLEEIGGELAKLPADRAPTRQEWGRLSKTWRARIDERIVELERLRGGLTECIGCGCLSLDRCAILNPGDRLAEQGPGPRFWVGDVRPERTRSKSRSQHTAPGDRPPERASLAIVKPDLCQE
ncbi:MAG: redox-sensitive transcriptional activator SoxR [Chloroflexia bacterium]|nr:redox-sensitive transcriptional activator SoxR [Chloroflexia bacterium]